MLAIRTFKTLAILAAGWLALSGAAHAANCSGLPYTLVNGSVADATQVMSNFTALLNCSNNNLAHNAANSDITSLSGLTTPLSISQGGTGNTSGQPGGAAGGVLAGAYPNPGFAPGGVSTSALGGNVVTNAKLAAAPANTVKGTTSGAVTDLTASDLVGILGLVGEFEYAAYTSSDSATQLVCDGRAISRTTYARLFAVIGTTWGVGDGSTTFNLPDGRSEFIQGADRGRGFTDAITVGATQADQVQGHEHTISLTQTSGGGNATASSSGGSAFSTKTSGIVTDNVHGTPRIGNTTHPRNIGATLMIFY